MLSEKSFEKDTFKTSAGPLEITFIGHGSLVLAFNGLVIHVDPVSEHADYSRLPRADLILVTHEHSDHLDKKAIDLVRLPSTRIIYSKACEQTLPGGLVMKNGDHQVLMDIPVEAVPAYNLVHMRPDGRPFHPKGSGNGYILTFGDHRVYIAGDTEDIPEMESLPDIAIAFLPMNLPYTMTPEMVARAARQFRPRILYPYHFGKTDLSELARLLGEEKDIEIRIRRMP